jgi:hypothetical protein
MANTYEYEYTDTFAGEANYCWVNRGKVSIPELKHYGYDGSHGYAKANKTARRELVKRVKRELGITGVKCRSYDHGDTIELRPYGMCTVAFITYCDA